MPRKLTIALVAILQCSFVFCQITSDKEALDTYEWIIENPKLDSKDEFGQKLKNLLQWQASQHPQTLMRTNGIGEFMKSQESYRFYQEIIVIFMLSEFKFNMLNIEYDNSEFAYHAMTNVLRYYHNILQLDGQLKNNLLDEYSDLNQEELKIKMIKLAQ